MNLSPPIAALASLALLSAVACSASEAAAANYAIKIDAPTRVMSYVMIAAIVGVGVVPGPLVEMARTAARTLL